MPPRKRRKFTTEQKATAVEIAKTSGKPIAQIAQEMDLTESALRQWIKQAQTDHRQDPQGPLTSQERLELQRLRRDLKRVEMERDFLTAGALSGGTPPMHCLKKAAAFFAKESSSEFTS